MTGEPIFVIRPSDNVYSFFMFISPTQKAKRKEHPTELDWDVTMSYILVFLNIFFQSVLLALIFEEVVMANVQWQNGIMKLGKDPVMGLFTEPPAGCNDGGALCFKDKGNFTCAPPSVQLTGRWNELDTDGDGVWTRAEVLKNREALKCKYVVDPLDVFHVLVNMLKLRESIIWLHPDIKSGTAIHFSYFTYAMGDLLMCGYRSEDMCSNILQRGFFDGPLKEGTAPRVGTTIESALKYCRALLRPGGTCEHLLPSTYATWKISSGQECGDPSYSKFTYTNPKNGITKSLLSVDYGVRSEYELAQEFWFMVFKSVMLFMWLTSMLVEYKEIIKIVTFCGRIPDAAELEQRGEDPVSIERDPADPENVRYLLQGITSSHRTMLVALCLIRTIVTSVLMFVGVSYLIKTNGYADLIMNGVALIFIAEVAQVLYDQILREEIKNQTEDIKPIKVHMYGIDSLNRKPALVDTLYVFGTMLVVYVIMQWQLASIVVPVSHALQCTCVSDGPQCLEAQKYNYDFWYNYWTKAVPGVFAEVDKLKATAPAGAMSYMSLSGARVSEGLRQKEVEREEDAELATNKKKLATNEKEIAELEKSNTGLEARLEALEALAHKAHSHPSLPKSGHLALTQLQRSPVVKTRLKTSALKHSSTPTQEVQGRLARRHQQKKDM